MAGPASNGDKPAVLIIGGLGYIGRYLALHIHKNQLASEVRLVDKVLPQLAFLAEEFSEACSADKFMQADASREQSLGRVFTPVTAPFYSYVFNCGGETRYSQEDSVYSLRNDALTAALARECARRRIPAYVEFSTGMVYKPPSSATIASGGCTESAPLKPWLKLARHKLTAEESLEQIRLAAASGAEGFGLGPGPGSIAPAPDGPSSPVGVSAPGASESNGPLPGTSGATASEQGASTASEQGASSTVSEQGASTAPAAAAQPPQTNGTSGLASPGAPELRYATLRLAHVYGEHDVGFLARGLCLARVYQSTGRKMEWLYGRDLRVNTVHVLDACDAAWRAAAWAASVPASDPELAAERGGRAFNVADDGDTRQEDVAAVVGAIFGIPTGFQSALVSAFARFNLDRVVDDVNDDVLQPWADLLAEKGITRPGPIGPFMERELLKDCHLCLSAERAKSVLGWRVGLGRERLSEDRVREVVESYARMGWWP